MSVCPDTCGSYFSTIIKVTNDTTACINKYTWTFLTVLCKTVSTYMNTITKHPTLLKS